MQINVGLLGFIIGKLCLNAVDLFNGDVGEGNELEHGMIVLDHVTGRGRAGVAALFRA